MSWVFCPDIALVSISITRLGVSVLPIHCLQIDATWAPTQSVCEVLNPETTKATTFALLITDVVLLLTMLVGLLRFRQNGAMIGVGKFLWRQVRSGDLQLVLIAHLLPM